ASSANVPRRPPGGERLLLDFAAEACRPQRGSAYGCLGGLPRARRVISPLRPALAADICRERALQTDEALEFRSDSPTGPPDGSLGSDDRLPAPKASHAAAGAPSQQNQGGGIRRQADSGGHLRRRP